jgi:NADH-quinone oxidoreductase subunit A
LEPALAGERLKLGFAGNAENAIMGGAEHCKARDFALPPSRFPRADRPPRPVPSIPPLAVYGVFLVGFVLTNLILAHIIGPRKKTDVKQMPYESGMDPVGDARQPFNVRFCLVAILYLVFDVELLFLYPWGVSAYADDGGVPAELRTTVFGVMLAFTATLVIAYVYAWRKGVFRWR